MQCSFQGQPGQAIIKLAQCHFERSDLAELLNATTFQKTHFQNDVYSKVSIRS